jgi:PAS domain S-box-containing protein
MMQNRTEDIRGAKGASSSQEPHPHAVQFYSDDAFLVDSISEFIGTSLLAGSAAIVIATKVHRDGIERQLRERGIDLAGALEQGRYVVLDSDQTLSRLLVDGWPNETRFVALMGEVIERARTCGGEKCSDVAIFGEMVSLLWSHGKCDAAIGLEQLWNVLARTHAFSLRCAYPMSGFGCHEHHEPFVKICTEHSDVIPEENYLATATDHERNRVIAELQQRAQALESEIAERRKAERLLQRREAQLWDYLESAVVGMHWVAADGTILWANRAELKLLGYDRDEYIGHPISEFHADQPVIQDILQRLGRHEELHGYEARLKCKGGSIREVRIHSNVFVEEGKFVHTRCFTIDVTGQKRANESRLRLAAIVESSEDAIVSKNLDGIVTSWNSSAEKMFGYRAEEMIGQLITRIIPPELRQEERRILATLRRGGRIEHFETQRITKAGERLDVSLTVSPIKDDDGHIIGAAKMVRDISQRKRMEEALLTTEKIAAVGRLAASVAHEINNPLEAITNLIYLAKNHDTASGIVRGYLADAEEELTRVAHLTKQTLGFYREQRGAIRTRVGIHLRQLLTIFSSKTKNKGIDVQLEIGQDPELVAIPGEIRQLLANILNNAIDAVGYGGVIRIRIAAGRRWDLPTPGVQITFIDSGPGIALSHRAKVFEPFYTTKPAVGTGLGLWICKSIVDRHAGKIQIRSNTTPGRSWTAVSVFLPAEAPIGNLSDGSAQAILGQTVVDFNPVPQGRQSVAQDASPA